MKKKLAIIQSNYIPWVGYFAIMANVDLFIVYECVQYTRRDWRNRNRIQLPDGRQIWLTIPVRQYSKTQPFIETMVAGNEWASLHFQTLQHIFGRNKKWAFCRNELELLYKNASKLIYLYDINRLFLNWIVSYLGLKTPLVYLDSYPEYSDPNKRLISILQSFAATHYFSGPTASNYIDPKQFEAANVAIEYVDYEKLIKETLIGPELVKSTSILQLILEGHHEFRCY